MKKLVIITPVKDEMENLTKLFQSIESQTIKIFLWVIVENDSIDGSKEFLDSIKEVSNVENFYVLNLNFKDKSYQLGMKYSIVVQHGFDFVKESECFAVIDFIGILDADCHPEPEYYQKLIDKFHKDSSLGIISGEIRYPDYSIEKTNSDHARGGCRVWRIDCFKQCPYETGFSADSTSSAKAIIKGWSIKSFNDAIVITNRKAGSRYISTYHGSSAYYRHIPFFYIILKTLFLMCKGNFIKSVGYITGYIKGYLLRKKRLQNPELIRYYKSILSRKLKKLFFS